MSSSQRRSGRQRAANTRLNDLPDSSPTQAKSQPASRKRKVSAIFFTTTAGVGLAHTGGQATTAQAGPARRARRAKETPETEPADNIDTEEEDEGPYELDLGGNQEMDEDQALETAEAVIPFLDVHEDPVNVAEQYANSKTEALYGNGNVNAFAKISGREWTYYVHEPRIQFGREPGNAGQAGVHIDLGPTEKRISRIHAELYYDSTGVVWRLRVLGRNGVKINDQLLKKGEDRRVRSGDVFGIAGTQMMFQPASGKPIVHPVFLERAFGESGLENNSARLRGAGANHDATAGSASLASDDHLTAPASKPPRSAKVNGKTATAPASSDQAKPKTPERPHKTAASSSKKKSPPDQSGIMMESTEQIDYSLETSKHIKPACSYAAMITWAILSSPEEALSLDGIYGWIKANFSYFRLIPSGWQNSIRHNLSLNPAFGKVPRRSDEPGKGMKWHLLPDKREEAIASANKQISKAGGRTTSASGSPAGAPTVLATGFLQAPQARVAAPGENRLSPRSHQSVQPQSSTMSPPSSHPPDQQMSTQPGESSTPTQTSSGLQQPAYAPTQGTLPVLSDETSPIPQNRSGRLPTGTDSSPVLNNYYAWNPDHPINTPAPRPHNLSLQFPTSVKLPTSHMIDSSPAPFWPGPQPFSSTPNPAGGYGDISPQRANLTNGNMPGAAGNNGWPSSSPPPATPLLNGADSPSKKSTGGLPSHTKDRQSNQNQAGAAAPESNGNGNGNGHNLPGQPDQTAAVDEGDDEGPIDLAKGFTSISSFHEQRHRGLGLGLGLPPNHSAPPSFSPATMPRANRS